MPFIDAATGAYPQPQVRLDKATRFTLVTPFQYEDVTGTVTVPAPWSTDFASIPQWLWGFLAPYGKQTLPAVLHDYLCDQAAGPPAPAPPRPVAVQLAERKAADELFRRALRDQANAPEGNRSVSRARATLFWAGVTVGRYQRYQVGKLALIGGLVLVLSVGLYAVPLLAFLGHDWLWAVLAALAPSLILGWCAAVDSDRLGVLIVVGAVAAVPVLVLLIVTFVVTLALNVIPWVVPWIRSRLPGGWRPGNSPEVRPTLAG